LAIENTGAFSAGNSSPNLRISSEVLDSKCGRNPSRSRVNPIGDPVKTAQNKPALQPEVETLCFARHRKTSRHPTPRKLALPRQSPTVKNLNVITMYKIIGADGKEYGPVTGDQIHFWITEGRVNAQTRACPAGATEWQPLGAFSEFAGALGMEPKLNIPPAFPTGAPTGPSLETLLDSDYSLDIGGCVSRGVDVLKEQFGLLFSAGLIYLAIECVIAGLGAIPFVGPVFSLVNLIVVGPLEGGLFHLNLQALRRKPASVGDVFAGFRHAFGQLILGRIVPGLLAGLCLIPALITAGFTLLPATLHHQALGPKNFIPVILVGAVCLIPLVLLQVNWIFTLPLIMDKKLAFWPAMQTSWKMVSKHWWSVFGLVMVLGLINIVGVLACCVGLLFTIPLGIATLMCAYESIFSPKTPANT